MVTDKQRSSIILSPDERLTLLARYRQAVSAGDRGEAWYCEHQLALSRYYERLQEQERSAVRSRRWSIRVLATAVLGRAA
jgi:hypothetical protein